MTITLQRFCIMTADRKKVEVGLSRNYYFTDVATLDESKTNIHLFNSFAKAKSSFNNSWYGITWNEEKQMFVNLPGRATEEYIIVPITVTYVIDE